MTRELDRVSAVSGDANVKAFLQVIREGESDHDDSAYTLINGGAHFNAPPWVHPFSGQSAPPGKAAGAYQFIPHTWERCQVALGLDDFSPVSQDVGAVYLIDAAGALSDVMQGDLASACARLASTWVSLPALGADRVARVFQQYGGTAGSAQPPQSDASPKSAAPATPQSEQPMPFALAGILQLIPELIGLFAKGDRGQQNAKAAQVVVDAFTQAVPGASGPGDALDKAAKDPQVAAAAKAAVLADPAVVALTEVGGGVAAARQFDLAQQAMAKPFYATSAVFWVSVLLLPLVYWFVGSIIIGGYGQILAVQNVHIPTWAQAFLSLFGASWTGEARSGAFNLVIGLVLGGICGVYYGVSVTQQRQQNTGS